jgi:hypothetical protein
MENLTYIYTHIDPTKLNFSNELSQSNFTFSDLPDYAYVSITQTKKLTEQEPIVLTNNYINQYFINEVQEFYNICKLGMPSFYKDTFWLITLLRLYIVFLYCKKNNINKFVHLEYDNLIYTNFDNLKILEPRLYFTSVGPFCGSAGFVFCNSLQRFEWFIQKLIQLLKKGEQHIQKFTQYDNLSEMILIDLIYNHTQDIIDYLPTLPFGEITSKHYCDTNMVFDCASYGQYLGGTNNGADPGWTGRHHHIGCAIEDKKITVNFCQKTKMPTITYLNNTIPIGNLHIHSKNLKKFV